MEHKKCLLCLQEKEEAEIHIKVFSEGTNTKDILLQHFNNNSILFHDQLESICKECWKAVWDFHQFYIKINEAHKLFMETKLEEKNSTNTPEEIKQELLENKDFEVLMLGGEFDEPALSSHVESDEDDVPLQQRKRVSPPKKTESTDVLDDILDLEKRTKIACTKKSFNKKLQLPSFGIKKKRGRPSKKQKALEQELKNKEILETLIKCELDGDASVPSANYAESEDDAQISFDENKSKQTRKMDLSREYDLFIAQHFKLQCSICQQNVDNFNTLLKHFRAEHKMRGYAMCCNRKLLKRGVLVDHIHTHQDPNYFKCTKCNKVLSDRRCLELHVKVHDEKVGPTFKCEICSKEFHKEIVLKRHVQNHVPEEERHFECPKCLKKYASSYLMNQHLKVVHLNMYSKICDICGKKITGQEALRRHQELHENVPRALLQCNICGMAVKDKYGLARHIKVRHTIEAQQSQKCPYPNCMKISPNLSAHKRHVAYIHQMERTHACPMCSKSFKRATTLKEHMTMHTGDVLYTCSFCPKTFNSNANMYAHRKKAHPVEWEQLRQQKLFISPEVKITELS